MPASRRWRQVISSLSSAKPPNIHKLHTAASGLHNAANAASTNAKSEATGAPTLPYPPSTLHAFRGGTGATSVLPIVACSIRRCRGDEIGSSGLMPYPTVYGGQRNPQTWPCHRLA
ncbi:hypothetical protein BaRGS_00014761 [Batillaria attramentaria]|uniref:Uncharacterized protein n=1 Tax=Batillaria attramentaria TaxID=370345 RepID=A0ABD0L3A0_9CAEN